MTSNEVLLCYLYCNCSAIKLVFLTEEQGYYKQRPGENPYSRSNPDPCRSSGLHINAQLLAFHEAQNTTAQNYHSPRYRHEK